MPEHSAEYTEYMQSKKWAGRKRRLFNKRGYACEMCGAHGPVEVHHKNYDRLGKELDEDLLIVCKECHPKADKVRAELEARRVAQVGIRWATLEEVETLTMKLVETKDRAARAAHHEEG
jgi:hypothetical protein